MQVTIDIPADRVAQLVTSAIEGGDPVTTASKGGWCSGINLTGMSFPLGEVETVPTYWWSMKSLFVTAMPTIEIIEVDDETTGHETKHTVVAADVARGLAVMAVKFPHQFAMILEDDTDAPCADAFLQSMLFGEERYA